MHKIITAIAEVSEMFFFLHFILPKQTVRFKFGRVFDKCFKACLNFNNCIYVYTLDIYWNIFNKPQKTNYYTCNQKSFLR